ncbi:hypothetical protein BDW69DRAFT_169969 [Aspergillus filifer]
MCDASSSKNQYSQGPPAGVGNGYGYPLHPTQPQGYGLGPGPAPGQGYGYNAPPAYESHFQNPYPSPAPSHSPQPTLGINNPYNAPQPYPNENINLNGYQQPGENALYYGHPIPPRSHGPSSVPVPGAGHVHGHGYGPAPGPALAPSMHGRTHSHSAPQPPQQGPPRSLLLRQSPKTHKIILIHPSGTPATAPPLYSLTSSPKSSKADYVLARGPDPNDPASLVGEVKSHTFSSKYDLIVRGTHCVLKESGGGNNYNIEIPGMGKYKWVTDMGHLTSNMKLTDESKSTTFASYGKSSEKSSVGTWKKFVGGKDRELVLDRPVSEFFTEVLLVSLYAVKMAKEGALEAAGEIVSAVTGA